MSDGRALGRSVSIAHAQELLRVSRRTIYYWIAAGKLVTLRTLSGGSQRVLADSIWFQRRLKELEERARVQVAIANINRRPQQP